MKNSRLIEILKTFSPDEIKEFDKFIRSPYYGCKNFVINFFREIKKHYPGFDDEKIDKRKIFSKLYGNKEYNDGLIRRMTSDLITLAEEFLMVKSFENTPMFRDSCFLHELRMRELNKMFEKNSLRIQRELHSRNVQNTSSLHKFFVENQIIGYMLKHKQKDLLKTVTSASDSLICMFLSSMNNKSQLISSSKRSNSENSSLLLNNFLKYFDYKNFLGSLENVNDKHSYFIKTDYYFNRLTSDINDELSYKKFKELVSFDKDYFNGVHKYNCYLTLAMFCVNKITQGDLNYLEEYFENINPILEEKLFLANSNLIHVSIIRNIINYSALMKRFVYAENFIKEYSDYFAADKKESILKYFKALKCLKENNLEKSLKLVSSLNFEEKNFKIDTKILKVKLLYELNYIESLYSEIDAFRHFLLKNVTKEITLISGKNFLRYVTKLVNLKEKKDKVGLALLKKKIQAERKVNEKEWLIEKIT